MKKCKKCNQEKPLTEFYADSRNKDGHQGQCKQCQNKAGCERQARLVKEEPWKIKDRQYKATYGITFEQAKQIYISQSGKCAICGNEFENRNSMHLDHNHSTGQVRQFLCSKCNHAIGLFKEDIQVLADAISYFNKWNNTTPLL